MAFSDRPRLWYPRSDRAGVDRGVNPTLLAASTVTMLLPNPVRLMLGYLLGALLTSITLGLLIVSALDGPDAA